MTEKKEFQIEHKERSSNALHTYPLRYGENNMKTRQESESVKNDSHTGIKFENTQNGKLLKKKAPIEYYIFVWLKQASSLLAFFPSIYSFTLSAVNGVGIQQN